jgi:hemophore-related protein
LPACGRQQCGCPLYSQKGGYLYLLSLSWATTAIGCGQVDYRMKEPVMFLSEIIPRRVVVGAIGAGAVTGTLLCATAGTAWADPPPRPPNCTAADVAGVAAGVATALSTYLFTHPDVNGFYTDLQDQPKDQIPDDVQNYFNANPQEQADLEGIRQPLTDIRQRCQWTPLLGQGGSTP